MNRDFVRTSSSTRKNRRNKRRARRQIKYQKSKALRFTYRNSGFFSFDAKRIMNIYDKKTIPIWYWSNYYKAHEWHYKSKITLWKSYAFALQEENKYLLDLLREKKFDMVSDVPFNLQTLCYCDKSRDKSHKSNKDECKKRQNVESTAATSCDAKEMTFEISEEMIKFFEQSIKHKLDLKKCKEASKEAKSQVKENQEVHYQRSEEVKLLYGEASSMIAGMETAVQLSYDKYCDLKSPKYWPNIPLNL